MVVRVREANRLVGLMRSVVGMMRSVLGMIKLGAVLLYACAELMVRRPVTRHDRAMWLHQLCRRSLGTFGVEVVRTGEFPERGVLISNHLSYVDIVVFASIGPCVFVSKSEVAGWPVLGWMTTRAGTVYVERGRRGSAKEAGSGMRVAAECGLPVVLFPEGTTSNGETILKFHSGLLGEAVAEERPVTAAYLEYFLTGDRGGTVRDDVAFWGEQPMLPHIFRFMALRGVRAEITIADAPIRFTAAAANSRKLAAVEARRAVCLLREGCRAVEDDMEAVG